MISSIVSKLRDIETDTRGARGEQADHDTQTWGDMKKNSPAGNGDYERQALIFKALANPNSPGRWNDAWSWRNERATDTDYRGGQFDVAWDRDPLGLHNAELPYRFLSLSRRVQFF